MPPASSLWTPEAQQADAEREALLNDAIRKAPLAKELTRQLRQVDRYLEVVFVDQRAESVPASERPPDMVPGRWHVRRADPRFMDAYFPIMGEDGEYIEPGSKLIDYMKEADLWREGALQELADRRERARKAQERKEALESEQRKEHMAVAWRAAKRIPGEGGMERRRYGAK